MIRAVEHLKVPTTRRGIQCKRNCRTTGRKVEIVISTLRLKANIGIATKLAAVDKVVRQVGVVVTGWDNWLYASIGWGSYHTEA